MLLSGLAWADRVRAGSSRTSGETVSIMTGSGTCMGRDDSRDEEEDAAETPDDGMGEISASWVSPQCLSTCHSVRTYHCWKVDSCR